MILSHHVILTRYDGLILTVLISAGTYYGSVRRIRKLHDELKNHLADKIYRA